MADLRDRYRRDYRSVPIPTPPRKVEHRRHATTQPITPAPLPPTAPLPVPTPRPHQPPTLSPQPTTLTRRPYPPSKPPERPSEPFDDQPQAITPKPTKRHARAAKKAQKKAHKHIRKQERKAKGRSPVKKFVLIPLFVILLLTGLTVGGLYTWYAYQIKAPLPIDKSYVTSAGFPVYLPDKLPAGYAVDKSTLGNQDNALVFTIRNSSDEFKAVQVSEQKLPDNFNPDKQLPDNPSGPGQEDHKFTTPLGKVEVATWQDRLVASLGAPKTWIIMNISTVPSSDADAIAKSFQPLRPSSPWEPLQDFKTAVTDKIKSVF